MPRVLPTSYSRHKLTSCVTSSSLSSLAAHCPIDAGDKVAWRKQLRKHFFFMYALCDMLNCHHSSFSHLDTGHSDQRPQPEQRNSSQPSPPSKSGRAPAAEEEGFDQCTSRTDIAVFHRNLALLTRIRLLDIIPIDAVVGPGLEDVDGERIVLDDVCYLYSLGVHF